MLMLCMEVWNLGFIKSMNCIFEPYLAQDKMSPGVTEAPLNRQLRSIDSINVIAGRIRVEKSGPVRDVKQVAVVENQSFSSKLL
ncbi:jg13191 [Pararge aegeria aegeria]|uniref:Jg13191 protein n=1 Tax=Pararge aegeria aegeria TaxID=348720 RepID=A0A8S4REB7_9NEOP|nr:jg13191 [Pararge aegeria aegeria]